jgi:hypothetical protein
MEINYTFVIFISAVALIIVGFLVYKNFKDEREFEGDLDYKDEHKIRHKVDEDENRR